MCVVKTVRLPNIRLQMKTTCSQQGDKFSLRPGLLNILGEIVTLYTEYSPMSVIPLKQYQTI